LPGQNTPRLIALKTGVLVKRGVDGIGNRRLIGGFLVVRFAHDGGIQRDPFAARLVDPHEVLVGMRFFLAAGVLLPQRLCRALAVSFGALQGEIGGAGVSPDGGRRGWHRAPGPSLNPPGLGAKQAATDESRSWPGVGSN
jgi:hypothetical protein